MDALDVLRDYLSALDLVSFAWTARHPFLAQQSATATKQFGTLQLCKLMLPWPKAAITDSNNIAYYNVTTEACSCAVFRLFAAAVFAVVAPAGALLPGSCCCCHLQRQAQNALPGGLCSTAAT